MSAGQDPPKAGRREPGNDNSVREDDLQAYVDGQLAPGDRVRVESYLASHRDDAERLAAYRKQNIGLHALFDPDEATGLPATPPTMAETAQRLDRALAATRPSIRFRNVAAGLALLVAAGGGGWIAYERLMVTADPLVAFTRQAAEAHSRLADHGPAGPGQAQGGARQVVAWLSAQPDGASLQIPDLEGLGFQLVADRVMPTASGKRAAQLLYQDEDGERITLYMLAGDLRGERKPVETSFTFRREGEVSQFFWQSGRFAYSLIGMMAQEKLLEIAEVISDQLHRGLRDAEDGAAGGLSAEERAGEVTGEVEEVMPKPEATGPGKSGAPAAQPTVTEPQPVPGDALPLPLPEPDSSPKET